MKVLTWTVWLHIIFQIVTSEVGGGHCGSNKWGPACDRNCPSNCHPLNNIVHCDVATGECLEGCNVGYHDTTCRRECNSNCINNTCNHIDGECSDGCKDNTSCIVTAPPINKPDTDITQTQCRFSGFTSCLGYSVSLVVVTVLLCALAGLLVNAIWRRNKRANKGLVEESVEMNGLDTEYSD